MALILKESHICFDKTWVMAEQNVNFAILRLILEYYLIINDQA